MKKILITRKMDGKYKIVGHALLVMWFLLNCCEHTQSSKPYVFLGSLEE